MKLIVGLGNPGPKYAGTRHNVGFEVVDYLAAGPGVGKFRALFDAQIAEATEGGEKVLFVKPDTFMNLSGRTVRGAADFYKLAPTDVLVVCDDYNLPLGKLRARAGGSHGGQNGLRNIQEMLGTDQYPRLRIGVGAPVAGAAVDHVLGRFKAGERGPVEEAVAKAAVAALLWVRQGLPACMNAVNGPDAPPKPKKPRPADLPPKQRPEGDVTPPRAEAD